MIIPPSRLPLRVVFFGTGDIARPALAALLARPSTRVLALVTQPDKPVGRHLTLTAPKIKEDAAAAGLPVLQPEKAAAAIPELAAFEADVFVVMAYGQLLPQALLDLPALACWNLHASLLPRHRGASPIQSALLHGDPVTGITVMHIARALDAGDVVLTEEIPILPGETGGSLHDRLAALAPAALNRALDALIAGTATRTPQDPALVTTLGKLTRPDGRLDWSQPAGLLARRIHAFDPWPGTFTTTPDGRILKIFAPVQVDSSLPAADPGTHFPSPGGQSLHIACGAGHLVATTLQPEGKRRMDAADFLRGHPLPPGSRLGI